MRRAAPLIIGGGPAGAAAAITLARAGCDVTLIERNATPADKVCGDFLSGEAIQSAAALGVAVPTTAPVTSVRLMHRDSVASARLPFMACGMARRGLDEALLQQAAANGVTVIRGHAVRGVERRTESLWIRCDAFNTEASTVFLATGKHELRGLPRTPIGSGLVGLKMYYALDPAAAATLRSNVELVLFSGGYAGLQLVESGKAVLCILVTASRLRELGGRWHGLLDSLTRECPQLARRLVGAYEMLERPLSIAGLPYGYVHAASDGDPSGLFRLGDQAAVIASLTGDGVALALASGVGAARAWLAHGNDASRYHCGAAARLARQMRLATTLHRLCLNRQAQRWVVAASRLCPPVLRLAANWTRSATISPLTV